MTNSNPTTTIYCIEGPHGSGKTQIINNLKDRGYNILDEGFLDMPTFDLNPQSFTMELIWVSRWIERALELKKSSPAVYFADRSPYSALLYAENGLLMKPIIQQMLRDLKRANIVIVNILVTVPAEILWGRIQARLLREPAREKYKEGSRAHMDTVVSFYNSHDDLWNHTIDNINSTDSAAAAIIAKVMYY
jgi:thymidylate kinase